MAYCPLLPGQCRNAVDCGECRTFSDVLHSYSDDLFWVCPLCLPTERKISLYTLLGHYQEIDCDICEQTSSLCQAALPPDVLTPAQWFSLLQQIRKDADDADG